jgi:hypothetical protein
LAFASSSAFFFAAAWSSLLSAGVAVPDLAFFFASRASFSSCLMREIRGSVPIAMSTSWRRRALSSFFLRARSDLFFFSVYRLSSRL